MDHRHCSAAPQQSPARPEFSHLILTRFNVRYGKESGDKPVGADPEWLADRFDLFEQFCLPSILAQAQQDFSWLLYFDLATPEPYAERARALSARRAGLHAFFCEEFSLPFVKKTILEVLGEPPAWILTTTVDNDDAVHSSFVAAIQDAQRFRGPEVLNCPVGFVLGDSKLYRRVDRSNAFISLSEPFNEFQSVFSFRHTRAASLYPVQQVCSRPMWLQVVHANNITNRVRGWRVPLALAGPGFPSISPRAETGRSDESAAILLENVTLYAVRALRDGMLAGAKGLARYFGIELRRPWGMTPGRAARWAWLWRL